MTQPGLPDTSLIEEAFAKAVVCHQAGQLGEAEELYRAVLAVRQDHADANFNLGLLAMQLGHPAVALPFLKTALATRPSEEQFWGTYIDALAKNGQPEAAREVLELGARQGLPQKAVRQISLELSAQTGKPLATPTASGKAGKQPSEKEISAIASLLDQGRFHEAEAGAQKLTRRFPNHGVGWKLLGVAILRQGRGSDALAAMSKAVETTPSDPEVHNNLGLALWEARKPEAALASYRQALALKPDYPNPLINLGAGLLEMRRYGEAESHFKEAVRLDPQSAIAMNNLALALKAQGKIMEAMNVVTRSIAKTDSAAAKELFVECVKHATRLKWVGEDLRSMLVRALSEPWGRPVDVAATCTSLIKADRRVAGALGRASDAWPERLALGDLFSPDDLAATTSDPLLQALMVSTPIADTAVERLLTMVRRSLLEVAMQSWGTEDSTPSLVDFGSALAQQCFINEYAYAFTSDEADSAGALRDALVAALADGAPVSPLGVVAVGAYFPLHGLPLVERLIAGQWPAALDALLTRQVREPQEELALRPTIPCLDDIEDLTSRKVRSQYEENPYPRWIKTAPAGKPQTMDEYVRRAFPLAPFQRIGKTDADILIAGCGTGQQSVEAAQKFPHARILAVDLSLTSLCYAKRKTAEMGLTSIDYAQADILKLGELDRSFDVVMCTGVLHHLADPFAGWQVLLSRLRPGGLMSLGFYSETARRNVVRARDIIAQRGYTGTTDDIRRCRQEIIELDAHDDLGTLLKSIDFFSISGCRDLLFHVQEHRMALPAIDAFLRSNGLQFIGFRINAATMQAYLNQFPSDPAATDLNHWQTFECEHPDTFWGMYQFWVQKIA